MGYYINYIGISHIGKIRRINQDSIVCNSKYISDSYGEGYLQKSGYASNKQASVFGVFDGMGGLSHGEIASSIAAKGIEEFKLGTRIISGLNDYCIKTNECICDFSAKNNLGSMGTTAAILVFSKHKISLCNIGDSKIYRIDRGHPEQISKDHTVKYPRCSKALLTQNLGIPHDKAELMPYFAEGSYQHGDIYMICSDGLTDMVSDEQIESIFLNVPFENAGKRLLDEALKAGGRDNISIIMCRIEKGSLFSPGRKIHK